MRKIPVRLREEMSDDNWYKLCCVRDVSPCKGRIEWHHHLIHEGGQVNEKFCILPLCSWHHDHIHLPKVKWHADEVMLNRATEEQIEEYGLEELQDYINNADLPWN